MIRVACAIIIQKGKILLAQNRADSDHAFQWEFPGGKIRDHETEEECIVREIKEELELEILVVMKLEPIEHDYGHKQIRLIPFVCSVTGGEMVLNDHQSIKWCKPDEILKLDLAGADRALLEKTLNRERLKEYAGK
ncbi:(deoxy)nucleoside triphosphate pyrophosphohydrolase [Maribellus sp. YY47]|uniref:(deoxy)nucleoside triphosphate pyrophosphohydrolase n=1 Tax=Maribellus sp. YY47 TaxID=2929486 RepID=UPI0020014491|nr:(deoxy)nucleoside triphosphate pyrophosphohydrolase [Maribellus sp. YY47]MCK3683888.1 (deoxy)nucleoside triphosphate pyrophosphohydrolase [Maribellus sp. YY47]